MCITKVAEFFDDWTNAVDRYYVCCFRDPICVVGCERILVPLVYVSWFTIIVQLVNCFDRKHDVNRPLEEYGLDQYDLYEILPEKLSPEKRESVH